MSQPFLLYASPAGQELLELPQHARRITIGRRRGCDLALPWDAEVSRVHAHLEPMGSDWVLCDDGISRNGTFVNGARLRGRRRLAGGDTVKVGATLIAVCAPEPSSLTPSTVAARADAAPVTVSPAQRRLLAALCRPLLEADGYAAPASNREIATELTLTVDTVKGTLSALFERFGLGDMPQNQKRAALAAHALAVLRVTA